jgi:hypothetical protein
MSSNRDTKSPRKRFMQLSNACSKRKHWLCMYTTQCPCACHVADLTGLLEELLAECDRRAAASSDVA